MLPKHVRCLLRHTEMKMAPRRGFALHGVPNPAELTRFWQTFHPVTGSGAAQSLRPVSALEA